MENEFTKVMSERTDEDLIKIVTVERERYNPTAIEAADAEIEKRNIDTSEFEKIREKATTEKEQKQKVDSNVVGSGIRFVNFIIDFFVWLILAFIISFIIGLFIPVTAESQGILTLFVYALFFGTFIAYYAILEIKFQKTIGKFVTKTKVVKMNGEKPENGDIITRSFCRLIPFDRISFLFVKNGIHDYLSKTKVVKDTAE
ncbi:RDD family protein [Mariniflexile sp. AS56]|uniref:RDD family protein n=1 Tax=Mariniflexile sp. AS56 TaxID=3063957 RepID=UPI0026F244C0|nr:RDD family protein [Mariniflexile sp. AS56]MDO7174239.1 RDD family protein [Mariniflexile sp. AS56]|tara:strand:- start:95 stop:697 length:603 start_codon:yes stop_codon:yes gene_type:complete